MQKALAFSVFALALLLSPAEVSATKVTPIQKVLELLGDMLAKGKKEKNAEEVRFSAFTQFCANQDRIKSEAIEKANTRIEELKASIQKAEADIAELDDRIKELDEDVGRWEKDIVAATNVRKKENIDYKATHADYSESLDALERAINVLKKRDVDIAQAPDEYLQTSLLQIQSRTLVPTYAKDAIRAFLQLSSQRQPEEAYDGKGYAAPEANAYESQSGGIIDMLEKLKQEFKDELSNLEEEELNSKHAYEQVSQELHDSIENANVEIERKKGVKAEREQDKADDEAELADTTADRDADQKYLDDLRALCAQKTDDFNARQKLRQEEIDAIQQAIDIISSDSVSGAGEKHLPQLVQKSGGDSDGVSLVQLRSSVASPDQQKVAEFLQQMADKYHSKLLSMVALKAAADPFRKVKKMIKDLIVKLMEEATEEAEHKGWCDTELTTNQQSRDSLTAEVNNLTAEIDELTSLIAKLTQEIADLTQEIAEIDDAVAKATADREAEKAKNADTIADAKEAQTAVENALTVLKEFYAKAAEATALVQKQSPAEEAPETFDESYKGMGSEGGGVVGMLEVILSDFARLENDTTAAEEQAKEEYDKFMFDSKMDKAMKANDIKHKTEKKGKSETALADAKKNLANAQEELDAALAYYEKLKPSCVDSGISYEERVKRREEEIQSLQEALKILTGLTMG